MDDNEMWNVVQACDQAYDGKFFYAVKMTRTYCRPSCKSKCPRRIQLPGKGQEKTAD